eukprot:TRINITY_DN1484_c0_g1_i8.p1 TRINITY_DN1484_c0_g1~~TRINITY_DN1484_c0_g1_i8.p1  ORF type:complete len:1297 (-),score=213.40 TRINITY_DN1484_c0_g1_i8:91-3807(-)
MIGRPYLPPMWSMGLQLARRGYTLQDMETVIKHMQKDRIPVDAFWADIELNDNYKTFTVNNNAYHGVLDFVKKLHDHKEGIDMKFVAITNPGIKKEVGYKYYDNALKEQVLIKSAAVHDSPYEGRTYAGDTVWLDYFLHGGTLVWAEGMHDLYELTNMDGVWISENEINNLCDGECRKYGEQEEDGIPNPFHNSSEFKYIPFRPTLDPLERNTLPMAAYQCCDDFFYKQYYTHNLFGLQTAKASYDSLYGIFEDKRFLVASRSTWPGSGHFSSHWLAENYATWESMHYSIAGMLNFNMFGIPHVGAPIGGYYGNTTIELLIRWYQLGAFSPLMLVYTNSNSEHKEPYFNETYAHYFKDILVERYSLLHWFYTKMFESFAWGGPVIHPLFFEFPTDPHTLEDDVVENTFMWARTLYVIPALFPRIRSTRAYLPNWRWYDFHTLEMVVDYHDHGVGEWVSFTQPLGHITSLIKGGTIIPYQHTVRDAKIMNVEDLKIIPALIIVAPDHTGKAQGSMVVVADGIRPHPDPNSNSYRHYVFTYMNNIFRINKITGFDFHEEAEYDYFWQMIILDVFGMDHIEYVCMMDTSLRHKSLEFWHATDSKSLIVHDSRMKKMPMHSLESIVWGTQDHHNFCSFSSHIEAMHVVDEGRQMTGTIESSDPDGYKMIYALKAMHLSDYTISLQIQLEEHGNVPWIVPDVVDETKRNTIHTRKTLEQGGFRTSPLHDPFYFEISDPLDSHNFVLTSRNYQFVYIKNYIHIKFLLNSRHIFGLGERIHKFELSDGLYSMWNYDNVVEETGLAPGNNMYGSHPFYMFQLQNPSKFAGVFFLTSNPMDVKIKHVGMQTQVDHIMTGGIFDAFFFNQANAERVLKEYHDLIGRPVAIPFWAFGYHQSRWGYRDIEHLKDVISKFEEFNMPLDAIWMDKDYMDEYKDFTVDTRKWYGFRNVIDDLHKKGKHFVAIIDAGIAQNEYYNVYTDGLERDVFIKGSQPQYTDKPLVGITWPGYSVFVDFLHPAAENYWTEWLQNFRDIVPFDGIWLDMNEPSNFCDGECPDHLHYIYYLFPLDFYDDLYYNPTHRGLEKGTISMEALHYGGSVHQPEFNYHQLYGLMQTRVTARFFWRRLHTRSFVISSSTFPGSGRWGSHWLGDNYSSWHYMEYSIAGMLNFQLFGIPFVGADICGYSGNTTVNLCARWMQLGAFYPMMRNHNGPTGDPQEPYVDARLAEISRKAIHTRYSLVRPCTLR